MAHVVDVHSLRRWKVQLDLAASECQVPDSTLKRMFGSECQRLFNTELPDQEYLSYAKYDPMAIRYLNDALVWASVLKRTGASDGTVVEMAPGRSMTIPMALTMLDFSGELVQVDNVDWPNRPPAVLRSRFTLRRQQEDIFTFSQSPIRTDFLVMNHVLDDLFIGLWAKENDLDFFGPAMDEIEVSESAWRNAMSDSERYEATLMGLAAQLARSLAQGCALILRNYPSRFETYHEQVDRVNFMMGLTERFIGVLRDKGFIDTDVDVERIPGSLGSKYPGSFQVLRNHP